MDHGTLSAYLAEEFSAEVDSSDDSDTALDQVRSGAYDLVIVNRIFDRTGESGIRFIEALTKERPAGPPVMLLSNFPEAQAEAEAVGAVPGFGKAALQAPTTRQRIAGALSSATPDDRS